MELLAALLLMLVACLSVGVFIAPVQGVIFLDGVAGIKREITDSQGGPLLVREKVLSSSANLADKGS